MTNEAMCDLIATEWNKVSPYELTSDEIQQFDKIRRFPSIYIPILYNAAQQNLRIFLHEDETCAMIFLEGVGKKYKEACVDYENRQHWV